MSADLPVLAGTARPWPLAWRGDLQVRRQRLAGVTGWSIKDPLTGRHFHLREEEYALVGALDGRTSLDAIRERFESEFRPLRFDPQRFQLLCSRLHQDGLLVSNLPGQAAVLLARERAERRRAWWRRLTGLLAIRLPGFDPEPVLRRLAPIVDPWFRPTGVVATLLLMLSALGLLVFHAGEIRERWPEFQQIVSPDRLPWLVVVLAATKICHELAHGLVCRRFGAECREMGVMLLLFSPCLYCDVSDAWRIANRWRRAAVAAAGIWSDLTLASLATFVWWFTQPGTTLHAVSLDAMLVCGLGTLVFNGNPLLRYDGYFILSDLCDLPNLWQESRAVLVVVGRRWILGLRTGSLPLLSSGRPWRLALYGLASQAYLVVVTLGSLSLLWTWADRWQIEWLAMLAAAGVGAGLVVPPVAWWASMLANPSVRRRIRVPRALLGTTLCAAAGGALLLIPAPSRVSAPIVLELADAEPLYVLAPGAIVAQAEAGADVRQGAVVVQLENADLRRELAKLTGEAEVLEARFAQLEGRRTLDEEAAVRLPGVRESLADARDRLAQRERDLERLKIVAPRSGVVLPPQASPPPRAGQGRLPVWSGTPLDARNRGAFLPVGTLVGWVGDPQSLEAVALVDASDVERLAEGQVATLQLALWPGRTFTGRVVETARRELEAIPPELVEAGRIVVRRDRAGESRPLDTYYQARLQFDAQDLPLLNRAIGEARIHAAPRPLGQVLADWARRTFRFEE